MKKIFGSIRIHLKRTFDRIRNERIKLNLLQAIPFWIGSLFTGLVAVLFTRLFAWTEEGSSYIFQHASWSFFIITPACFVIALFVVRKFAPYARGSGIPQVIA